MRRLRLRSWRRQAWQTGHQTSFARRSSRAPAGAPHRGHCPRARDAVQPAGVRAAVRHRVAERGADRASHPSSSSTHSRRRRAVGRAGRATGSRPPQVPDAGDYTLIEEPRLHRRAAAAEAHPERIAADLRGVRADVREVRLEHRAAEPALVVQRDPASARELEREAVPTARRGRLVDGDPARHPEVQPDVRPPSVSAHRNFRAGGSRSPSADQRRRHLTRRVRAGDVRVASSTATISRPSTRSSCCRPARPREAQASAGHSTDWPLDAEGDHRAAVETYSMTRRERGQRRARRRPPTRAGSTRRSSARSGSPASTSVAGSTGSRPARTAAAARRRTARPSGWQARSRGRRGTLSARARGATG